MLDLFRWHKALYNIRRHMKTLGTPDSDEFKESYRECVREIKLYIICIGSLIYLGIAVKFIITRNKYVLFSLCGIVMYCILLYCITFKVILQKITQSIFSYLDTLEYASKIDFCKNFRFKCRKEKHSDSKYYNICGYKIPVM